MRAGSGCHELFMPSAASHARTSYTPAAELDGTARSTAPTVADARAARRLLTEELAPRTAALRRSPARA